MNESIDQLTLAVQRATAILAAMYVNQLGLEQNAQAERLSHCGLSNTEIAAVLGLTPNAVNVALHRARKGGKVRRKPKKAA